MAEAPPFVAPGGDSPADRLPAEITDLACARLLAEPAEAEGAVLAELCNTYPEHAAGLRRLAAELRGADRILRLGMVMPVEPDPVEPDPVEMGPFRVERRLGEGAFGIVYLCIQVAPIERRVAVKVLRPGAGNRQTLARFEAERQVLARMSHPAIANVFDAGALPDGRPFFVMEYVEGSSITAFADRRRLTIGERLDLFLALCDGVWHAHQRGVIHRDLKPSNVLVSESGEPQPKIIDFGLAKVLRPQATSGVQVTEIGGVLGTPGYMSPEQSDGQHDDVDTRSDVFSLGVILYVLLTGEMPWSQGTAQADTAPTRPSARFDNRETGSEAAAQRAREPRRLHAQLCGDLDWITLRALERDRERRYQSVRDLAEDLRRHMRSEPVLAGPPSRLYRLRKLARRYRVQLAAVAAVLLSLLLGLLGVARYARRAHENLQRFETLAIGSRLALAQSLAGRLYPPWPELLPDIERWLREHGEPLGAELPRLQRAIEELRAQAVLSRDVVEAATLRPIAAEVEKRRATIAYVDALLAHPDLQAPERETLRATLLDQRDKQLAALPALERLQEEGRTWRFGDAGQQFLHDTLVRFADELRRFCEDEDAPLQVFRGQRQDILDGIADLERRQEEWQRVREDIAHDPRYRGLDLLPQFGLVPLGRDPESELQEFYHARSGAKGGPLPKRGADGHLVLDDNAGIVFVLLPGGTTSVGAQGSDPGAPYYDSEARTAESPVNEVTLAPFFFSKHELTQSQWWSLTGTLPSHFHSKTVTPAGREITIRHPVENVTWSEGQFGLAKHGLDLPTEAQWEYACRAGTTTTWATGDTPESIVGSADMPSLGERAADTDSGGSWHASVGSFRANAFGIHDMVGNVAEWCRDSFSSLAYLLPPRAGDGLRPVPEMQARAVRGGAYDALPRSGSSAVRRPVSFNTRSDNIGLRAIRRVELRGTTSTPMRR
ncbi:MAG: bifunctional serine/threonine-protein kinase/formylglycine-generating enzyme family protein [Planctomycetota bacterium]